MMQVTDQTGYSFDLALPPKRVVSLVPSQTELLFDLGLDREVVGITKFCVHPEAWFRSKVRVGGTKKVDIGRVKGLMPDLVIANKEENTREDVEAIREFCPVWTSDIVTVEDALSMIVQLSALFRLEVQGCRLEIEIRESFRTIRPVNMKAAYLIWKDPYMAAGGDTYIHEMMKLAGISNVFADRSRYPAVSLEEIAAVKPELILLSSEPYPFKMKHLEALSEIFIDSQVRLVDGEMFSWYGSRMNHFANYISSNFT